METITVRSLQDLGKAIEQKNQVAKVNKLSWKELNIRAIMRDTGVNRDVANGLFKIREKARKARG